MDAKGLLDDDLLEDVGFSLLQRCKDIVVVKAAKTGKVECPRCANRGQRTIIERISRICGKDVRDEIIKCPTCEWEITWGDYALSYKRKQLNAGATEMFETYIRKYTQAKTPKDKLFAIGRLIHEFHHSLVSEPSLPGRPVCANLIQGRLSDIVHFLNELSFGSSVEIVETRETWRRNMQLQKHRFDKMGISLTEKST